MSEAIDARPGLVAMGAGGHPVIASAWTFAPAPVPGTHFVAPDARVDIVVRIDASARADAFVFGPDMKPTRPRFDARTRYLGLRLRVPEGASLFGPRATELLGGAFLLATWATREPDEVLECVHGLLDALVARDRSPAPRWLADVVRFAEAHPTMSVDALARATGIATRSLSRMFARWIGPSPKQLLRLFRARAATRALASGDLPAEVSAHLEYADQAHLTREIQALFDATPGAIRRDPRLAELFNPGVPSSPRTSA
jgi:AraC-like DNA-binding protein